MAALFIMCLCIVLAMLFMVTAVAFSRDTRIVRALKSAYGDLILDFSPEDAQETGQDLTYGEELPQHPTWEMEKATLLAKAQRDKDVLEAKYLKDLETAGCTHVYERQLVHDQLLEDSKYERATMNQLHGEELDALCRKHGEEFDVLYRKFDKDVRKVACDMLLRSWDAEKPRRAAIKNLEATMETFQHELTQVKNIPRDRALKMSLRKEIVTKTEEYEKLKKIHARCGVKDVGILLSQVDALQHWVQVQEIRASDASDHLSDAERSLATSYAEVQIVKNERDAALAELHEVRTTLQNIKGERISSISKQRRALRLRDRKVISAKKAIVVVAREKKALVARASDLEHQLKIARGALVVETAAKASDLEQQLKIAREALVIETADKERLKSAAKGFESRLSSAQDERKKQASACLSNTSLLAQKQAALDAKDMEASRIRKAYEDLKASHIRRDQEAECQLRGIRAMQEAVNNEKELNAKLTETIARRDSELLAETTERKKLEKNIALLEQQHGAAKRAWEKEKSRQDEPEEMMCEPTAATILPTPPLVDPPSEPSDTLMLEEASEVSAPSDPVPAQASAPEVEMGGTQNIDSPSQLAKSISRMSSVSSPFPPAAQWSLTPQIRTPAPLPPSSAPPTSGAAASPGSHRPDPRILSSSVSSPFPPAVQWPLTPQIRTPAPHPPSSAQPTSGAAPSQRSHGPDPLIPSSSTPTVRQSSFGVDPIYSAPSPTPAFVMSEPIKPQDEQKIAVRKTKRTQQVRQQQATLAPQPSPVQAHPIVERRQALPVLRPMEPNATNVAALARTLFGVGGAWRPVIKQWWNTNLFWNDRMPHPAEQEEMQVLREQLEALFVMFERLQLQNREAFAAAMATCDLGRIQTVIAELIAWFMELDRMQFRAWHPVAMELAKVCSKLVTMRRDEDQRLATVKRKVGRSFDDDDDDIEERGAKSKRKS